VEERGLKMTKCRGRRKKVMETGIRFASISEKYRKSLSRLSFNEFKSATNKTLQNTSLPQSKEFV